MSTVFTNVTFAVPAYIMSMLDYSSTCLTYLTNISLLQNFPAITYYGVLITATVHCITESYQRLRHLKDFVPAKICMITTKCIFWSNILIFIPLLGMGLTLGIYVQTLITSTAGRLVDII
ncbi:unnamed protein product, partial [Rotaria magnacalcarata]